MTIFFVSAHDEPTHANLQVAQLITCHSDVKVFEANATRDGLLQAFADNPDNKSVFSMSHGSKFATIGSDGGPALDEDDAAVLSQYNVFAWACLTGVTLGHRLAQTGTTWWGYDNAVTAPDDRPEFLHILSNVVANAKTNFASGIDASSIALVLDGIRTCCVDAIEELNTANAPNVENFFPLYSFCNQFWQRLSVWIPGVPEPLRHPNAPVAYYDI